MSEQPQQDAMLALLEFDQGDRMKKSLKVAKISVQEMADYMGVARETVSTWLNGRNKPATAAVKLWALKTGAPYKWLVEGSVKEKSPSPSGDGLPVQSLHTESNRRPFHYNSNTSNVHQLRPARRELAVAM